MSKVIDIRNIGPIRHLHFELPQRGGLVTLEGPNGSGKTTALEVIGRIAQGEPLKDLSVHDRELSGSADVLGVQVTLGLGRQRASKSGELVVHSLSAGIDPSILVDAGLKSPEANDARRIAMLCRMAGVKPNIALFAEVVPNLKDVTSDTVLASESVPEMADRIRRRLHERALAFEREAEDAQNRAAGLAASVEGVNLSLPSPKEARAALELASTARANARAQAEAYRRASDSAQVARSVLEQVGASQIEELRAAVERAGLSEGDARELESSARADLERAKAVLEARSRDLTSAVEARMLAEVRLKRAVDGDQAAERARQVLASLDGLPNPSPEQLAELEGEHAASVSLVSDAEQAERANKVLLQAGEVRGQAEALLAEADKLRSQATATEHVVAKAIAPVAPMGLAVENGRLVINTSRGKTVWDELSMGERWRIALDCAIAAVGDGGILSIRQEACESLDPENLKAIHERAYQAGVTVISARATSGDLTAHLFNPADEAGNGHGLLDGSEPKN